MRRLALMAALTALLAQGAAPAAAYWRAGGTGSWMLSVDTLVAGNAPTALASGQVVTVSWAQSLFQASVLGGYTGGGYSVRRYPAGGGAGVTPNVGCNTTISGSAATLSCQEQSVPAGSWRYTVTPLLGTWTGTESATGAAVGVGPAAPSLTSASAQNPAAGQQTGPIALAWGAVTGATGYNVYRRAGSGSYDFSAPLNGATPLTATTFTDPGSGLTGSTTYEYVVRGVTAGTEGASSNELAATAIRRPPAPASATAGLAAGAQIGVTWPAVSGAAGYNVYRRTLAGAYDYATPLNGAATVSGTSFTDTTSVDGTGYRYVVRAVITGAGGAQVEGADSPESAAVVADGTAPSSSVLTNPGTPLRGTVAVTATATDAGSGIASVRVEYATSGGSSWTTGCTATVSPYTCNLATAPIADGLYDLRAVATDVAGNTTTSALVTSRRFDNTGPSVSVADPGAFVRATITLTVTAADGGSGVASVRLQRAPAGTSTWTDVCTDASSPYSCSLNTTTLADGSYDLRAIATDVAGNTTTSALVSGRVVDNTAPTGADIHTTNAAGGTAGRPEAGDIVTYSFSEPMKPGSILAGWTGSATPVVARFTNGNPDVLTVFDAANSVQLALGSMTSGKKYVTGNTTFPGSSIVFAGNDAVLTLGTPSGATNTANGSTTLQWTVSTTATDRAGNAMTAGTIFETGLLDLDF